MSKKYSSTIHGCPIKLKTQGNSGETGLCFIPGNHHQAGFGRHHIGQEDNNFNHPTVLGK
jgi:hypothetical protein